MANTSMVRDYKLAPEQMTERITPAADLFVLAHMGIPEVAATDWSLEICGLVERPMALSLDDLARFPKRTVEAIHKCAGSPVNHRVATRQIANVVWGGVDMRDLLRAAGPLEGGTHLWAYGLEYGRYRGSDEAHYRKDVPLGRIAEGDVLLAWELNGEPLSAVHGFPARLVVPGFFGTNSVKWICRLELAAGRPEGLFTTTLYNDPAEDGSGTRPVWEVAPESLIVSPGPADALRPGPSTIWGWAWSDAEVRSVEISTDGGHRWRATAVEPRRQRSWQRFSAGWEAARGVHVLQSRAVDAEGRTQPPAEARNAVYAVEVMVA